MTIARTGWSLLFVVALATVSPSPAAAQPSCQPGRYASAATGACEACDLGRYQPATGQESCFPCETGRFADAPGRAACAACGAGRFQDAPGASTCLDCAAGSARDATGQTSCTTCGPGRFSPASGATSCEACGPGRFSDAGANACAACGPGRYATDGAATCKACGPGRYASSGAEACTSCGPGRFSPGVAAESCTACPPGRFSGVTLDASTGEAQWASTCTAGNAVRCYKTKDLKNPKFSATQQPLSDAFATDTATVKGPAMVCAPVDLGSGVEDPSARQCCYKIAAPGVAKPHPQVATSGGRYSGSQLEVLKSQLICEPCGADPLP